MAATTIKEQFPKDVGDGTLTIIAYPNSEYVTVVGRQDSTDLGEQSVYLIVDKQELIDALTKED